MKFDPNLIERTKLYWRRLSSSGWDSRVKLSLEVLKELQETVEKPSALRLCRSVMSLSRLGMASDLYFYDTIDKTQWRQLMPMCIRDQLLEILDPLVTGRFKTCQEGSTVFNLIATADVRLAWVLEKGDNSCTNVFAHNDNYDASVIFVRNLLWEKVNRRRLVVIAPGNGNTLVEKGRRASSNDQVRVATDSLVDGADSRAATEWATYLRRCMDHGVRRTMLFYGIPGCGKTTLARTICDRLGVRSLRLRVEDIGLLGTEAVSDIIDIFEPEAVIFDDLDRSMSQVALLEMMEMLHRRVQLVFATVNHLENLADALRRPGRFDEICHVSRLDEEAVRSMLGAEAADAFDIVKEWPAAFINEYVIRRRLLGADRALTAVKELQQRIIDLGGKVSDDDGKTDEEEEEDDE